MRKHLSAADFAKENIVSLFFPRRCPVCGDIVLPRGQLICPQCVLRLSPVRPPACRKCGKEVLGDHWEYCSDCARRPKSFDSGLALLNYNDAARHSLAAVKYKNRREYLDFYGEAMARRFEKNVRCWQAEVLIPVPIHPSRRRQRGFNQAEELAGRLSRSWDIPMDAHLLIRSKKTLPQRNLNPSERLKNLQEAFQISSAYQNRRSRQKKFLLNSLEKSPVKPFPRTVILVDDIYTTGSTIEACSRVLKAAGAEKVYFVVICIGNAR